MRSPALLLPLALVLPTAPQAARGQQSTMAIDGIMARVAANQDRAVAERAHFVYVQHARVLSRKGSTVMCEEITDSRVVPGPKGQQQTLLTLQGHALGEHGKIVNYTQEPKKFQNKAGEPKDKNSESEGDKVVLKDSAQGGKDVIVSDTDVDLVENMRDNLLKRKNKDGISENLFPLATEQQKEMVFHLKGREPKNGRDTFHITFEPKEKDEFGWKGDAWIDATAFQPVVVRTAMSKNIPLAARIMLGTSVPGLGFTAIYAPQPVPGGEDVWFPASFGTEFKLNVLFFFHRHIVLSADNRQFERTHVTSTLHSDDPAMQPATSQP